MYGLSCRPFYWVPFHALATRSRGDRHGRGRVCCIPDSPWRALQPFHGAVRVHEGHHEREREPRHEVSLVEQCEGLDAITRVAASPLERRFNQSQLDGNCLVLRLSLLG